MHTKTSSIQQKPKKRPSTQSDVLLRRYRFTKASFAIEGIHLNADLALALEECIRMECTIEQMDNVLKSNLPQHVSALRR